MITFSQLYNIAVHAFPEYKDKDYRPYGRNAIFIFLDDQSVIVRRYRNGLLSRRQCETEKFLKMVERM